MKRLAFFLLLSLTTATAQGLRVGLSETEITPPKGSAMAGYYTNREATGTHDPLHAKAMVLSDGSTKIAIVACDLVSLPRDISQAARQIILKQIGLEPDHIMITATHAHTTPVILTNPTRYNLDKKTQQIAQEYTDGLAAKIASSIVKANSALMPVTMFAGVGNEKTLGFSRRYFMKDGTVGWNPGKLNAEINRPAAPVDAGVPVMYFEAADSAKPLAAYVNFGVHQDTTGGLEFSADYSYTLAKVLKMAKGDDFFTLFTIGAAGNVNHIDVSRKEPQQSFSEAARIGAVLAGEVLKVIQQSSAVADTKIRISDKILQIPVPQFTEAEIASANQTQATQGTDHPAPFLDLVKAARVIELNARQGKPLDAEVQMFTIGNTVAIVGFPGEMFAEFGIQLKEDSPFPVTILSELANGAYVYIPNRIAYKEGNYEPTAARLPAGSGELLIDSAQQQLLQLARRTSDGK
jgi:neutral ceramidase